MRPSHDTKKDAQWAQTYKELGVYLGSHADRAIAAFRTARHYAPRDPQIEQLLALAYYRGGRRDECAQVLRELEWDHADVFTALLREFPELAALRQPSGSTQAELANGRASP